MKSNASWLVRDLVLAAVEAQDRAFYLVLTAVILALSGVVLIIRLPRGSPSAKAVTGTAPDRIASSVTSFRISGLPGDITIQWLEEFLGKLPLDVDHAGPNVTALSLSRSNISSDASRYQTAVVTFATVPVDIRPCTSPAKTVSIRMANPSRSEITVDSNFIGLTPLNSAPHPIVDIVAITGLAGHAFGSWKQKGGTKMWLRDFLAEDLNYYNFETRILTYGYDSTLVGSTSDASIHEYARNLLEALKTSRESPQEVYRPIIFIAHSLGGLVLKHALTEASKGDVKDRSIFKCCYAAFFFGVPNRGLQIEHLISLAKGRKLVDDLGEKSQVLPLIHREFQRVFTFDDSKIFSIYETKDTRAVQYNPETKTYERTGPFIRMVSRESAINAGQNEKIYHQLSIDEDHSNIVKFSRRDNPDYVVIRGKIRECVEEAPGAMRKRLALNRDRTETEKECLRSLVPSNNNPTPEIPPMKLHPGTCGWILQNDSFNMWQTATENSSKLLWVYGQPGTGKTALMTFVREHFAQKVDSNVVYFFCDTKYMERRTAIDVLKSLVHQLLSQNTSWFKYVMPEYEKFQIEKEKKWSAAALWDIFTRIMTDPTGGPLYCIIDAIDECDNEPGQYSRSDFLQALHDFYHSPSAPARSGHIIFCSRPLVDIEDCLPDVKLRLRLEDYNQADIYLYIAEQVDFLAKKLRYTPIIKAKVQSTLEAKSGNMFLWVTLTVNELAKRYNPAKIDQLLSSVPKTLFAYYEHILSSIPADQVERARCMLMWIVYATNPIPMDDLARLIAIMDNEVNSATQLGDLISMNIEIEIKELCGPFVKIQNDCVIPLHRSVSDFFTTGSDDVCKVDPSVSEAVYHRRFHVPSAMANGLLLRACISMLSLDDMDSDDDWTDEPFESMSSFGAYKNSNSGIRSERTRSTHRGEHSAGTNLPYEAVSWPFHARLIHVGGESRETVDALHSFVRSRYFIAWKESFWWNQCFWGSFFQRKHNIDAGNTEIQPLYVASQLHIRPLVQMLLEDGDNVNTEGGLFDNALQAACGNGGDISLVQLLVERGADVNKSGGYHGTPLIAAVVNSNMAIVAYLLSKRADVSLISGHWGCAVQAAAFRGRLDMVKLLSRHNASMYDKCGEFGNPLLAASWSGYLPVVNYLIDCGMHPNTRGRLKGFPLQAATRRNHYAVVKTLLERGADVNMVGGVMGSAIHAAIGTGESRLVQLLISNGANVNIDNPRRGTPLQFAASVGHIGIVQSLVAAGAKSQLVGLLGATPEDIARQRGHSDVVRFLQRHSSSTDE